MKYSFNYHDTWPAGIACLSGGLMNIRDLITHTFPLEKAVDAFEFASGASSGCLKVQIVDQTEGD